MTLAEVKVISESTLLDVPAKLRRLADDIDAGRYGRPQTCAVVLITDDIDNRHIFSWGPRSDAAMTHLELVRAARVIEGV